MIVINEVIDHQVQAVICKILILFALAYSVCNAYGRDEKKKVEKLVIYCNSFWRFYKSGTVHLEIDMNCSTHGSERNCTSVCAVFQGSL